MPNNFLYINFFGGSYGNFVKKFLKLDLKEDTVDLNRTDFHYQLNYTFSPTLEIAKTHENENIKDTKKNLKITYEKNDIDLIARNVWNKESKQHIEQAQALFVDFHEELDIDLKKIVCSAFYKSKLLDGLIKWNPLLKKTTLELPLASFFCSIENWVTNWKKIFQRLEIEADDEYISYGHTVFHNTQKSLLAQHDFYKNLDWKDQDIIGKGNILGEFYYKKHAEHQVPIDMVKYRDTCDMLIKWIKELNNGNVEF